MHKNWNEEAINRQTDLQFQNIISLFSLSLVGNTFFCHSNEFALNVGRDESDNER
jgi:hypothetical protein